MNKIFGDYIEELDPELDSLEMTFTPSDRSIKHRWKNNRLSAQFVAEYFTAFLPVNGDADGARRIEESKEAISYVANELIENAMKFNDVSSNFKVRLGIYFLKNMTIEDTEITALLLATNSVTPQGIDKFQAFLTELLAADPEELYISQVEKSMEEEHREASGLGFLTMINDYSARLGWKFETIGTDTPIYTVTTMARITV